MGSYVNRCVYEIEFKMREPIIRPSASIIVGIYIYRYVWSGDGFINKFYCHLCDCKLKLSIKIFNFRPSVYYACFEFVFKFSD